MRYVTSIDDIAAQPAWKRASALDAMRTLQSSARLLTLSADQKCRIGQEMGMIDRYKLYPGTDRDFLEECKDVLVDEQ